MQMFVYLFNKNDVPIGIYEYIQPFINSDLSEIKFMKTSADYNDDFIYGENYYSGLSLTLENIFKGTKKINITQNKCIYRGKESIFYIKIDKDELPNTVTLEPYFKNVTNLKLEHKIVNKYQKYLANVKSKIDHMYFSLLKPSLYDVLFMLLSAIVVGISFVVDISAGKYYMIIILLISIGKWLLSSFYKMLDFKLRYHGTNSVSFSKKKEIHDGIINNLIGNYKSFEASSFEAGPDDNSDCFLFSDKENENLQKCGSNIKIELSHNRVNQNNNSKTVLGYVFREKVNSGKVIYDSSLCGIDSELHFYENATIKIKKVNYFSYVSNDEIIYKNFTLSSDPKYYLDGAKYTLYPNGGFKNIEGSPLTNLIGINIICLLKVKDKRYVLINRQCTYSDVNHSKFVPSGSGSLEYRDFKKCRNKSFSALLQCGMYRELKEESFIDLDLFSNHKSSFSLLGCARLFSKAGKPDFFGMIEIEVKEEEIDDILRNYNQKQNSIISVNRGISNLESTFMGIVDYQEFMKKDSLGNLIFRKEESPQLRYTKYLLNKFNQKNGGY